MTLQGLSKYLDKYDRQVVDGSSFESLKGLPFYNWQLQNMEGNTFNHAIGLPQKNGQPFPLFDYEQLLYNELQQHRLLWIKKATGLGVTEFMLRYMAWLCFANVAAARNIRDFTNSNPRNEISVNKRITGLSDSYDLPAINEKLTDGNIIDFTTSSLKGPQITTSSVKGSQMCIVTGPRIELAITLINRMKGLFANNFSLVSFDSKETVIELNGVHIEAYPSHHLDAMRGLDKVSFIYLDEADFFPPGQQQDARDVSERYIAKSNPWIVMVSTPNAPEQLFDRIEHEPESTCLYKRLFLDYTHGLGKIYTEAEIADARRSPSFEREYNLKYLGLIGNVFHTKDIEAAIERGRQISSRDLKSERLNSYTQKSVGIDPGYGSSSFAICVTELVDGLVNVLHAEEYARADFNEMIETTLRLMDEYNITFEGRCRIFVDGANPSFIRALKDRIAGEDANYEHLIARLKTNYGHNFSLDSLIQNMFVVPIAFSREHKSMLSHVKQLMEYDNGRVAINPKFNKLITSLRTAVADEWSLDKEATSHDDLFDSFRLSLQFWH